MKTLLKQARDALTANVLGTSGRMPKTHAAIAAIEAELAKPDQQPVAWMVKRDSKYADHYGKVTEFYETEPSQDRWIKEAKAQITPLYAAPTDCKWPTCHSQQYQQALATEVADQIIGKPDTRPFDEVHPANPAAKCKCEHWQYCAECHPTAFTPAPRVFIAQPIIDGVVQTNTSYCNPHPDAPHGFDRGASHGAGTYICECQSWQPGEAS